MKIYTHPVPKLSARLTTYKRKRLISDKMSEIMRLFIAYTHLYVSQIDQGYTYQCKGKRVFVLRHVLKTYFY